MIELEHGSSSWFTCYTPHHLVLPLSSLLFLLTLTIKSSMVLFINLWKSIQEWKRHYDHFFSVSAGKKLYMALRVFHWQAIFRKALNQEPNRGVKLLLSGQQNIMETNSSLWNFYGVSSHYY